MKERALNIINAADVTNWFKFLTWGNTVAAVRFADIKQREFVSNNTDAVAKVMSHSYIKRFILLYMNELVGTSALRAPESDAEMSDSVRAAAADGLAPYVFSASDVTPEFTSKIKKLNRFLFDAAVKYINQQTKQGDTEFKFDIQYLLHEFPDYRDALARARWHAHMPEKKSAPNIDLMRKINGVDNEK